MALYQIEILMAELKTLPTKPGLLMTDLLDLPETTRQLLQWILRRKEVELKEIAEFIEQPQNSISTLVAILIQCGMLEKTDRQSGDFYRVRMRTQTGSLRRSVSDEFWKAIDDTTSLNEKKQSKS